MRGMRSSTILELFFAFESIFSKSMFPFSSATGFHSFFLGLPLVVPEPKKSNNFLTTGPILDVVG